MCEENIPDCKVTQVAVGRELLKCACPSVLTMHGYYRAICSVMFDDLRHLSAVTSGYTKDRCA